MLTIVIPVFNKINCLENCFNSLKNLLALQGVNAIIVDDESTDGSLLVCQDFAELHSNCTVVSKKNGGVGSARNLGINLAKTKYISFLDPDDTLVNFESVLQKLYNNNDFDLFIFGANFINKENIRTYSSTVIYELETKKLFSQIPYLQKNHLFNQCWNKVFSLSLIKKHNLLFDEKVSYGEDFDFVVRYLSFSLKTTILPSIHYNYSISITGLNFSRNNYSALLAKINLQEKLSQNFSNVSFTNYCAKIINQSILSFFCKEYEENKKRISAILNKSLKDELLKNSSRQIGFFVKIASIFVGKNLFLHLSYFLLNTVRRRRLKKDYFIN